MQDKHAGFLALEHIELMVLRSIINEEHSACFVQLSAQSYSLVQAECWYYGILLTALIIITNLTLSGIHGKCFSSSSCEVFFHCSLQFVKQLVWVQGELLHTILTVCPCRSKVTCTGSKLALSAQLACLAHFQCVVHCKRKLLPHEHTKSRCETQKHVLSITRLVESQVR